MINIDKHFSTKIWKMKPSWIVEQSTNIKERDGSSNVGETTTRRNKRREEESEQSSIQVSITDAERHNGRSWTGRKSTYLHSDTEDRWTETLWNALIARTRATDRSAVMQPSLSQEHSSTGPPDDRSATRSGCESISLLKLRRLTVNLAFQRVNWITEFASCLNIHPSHIFHPRATRSTYLLTN